MPKCIQSKNRKRLAVHKLSKLVTTNVSTKNKNEIEDNSHKATSCTKQRRLNYGIVKVDVLSNLNASTKLFLKNLPRKAKKLAKRTIRKAYKNIQ